MVSGMIVEEDVMLVTFRFLCYVLLLFFAVLSNS